MEKWVVSQTGVQSIRYTEDGMTCCWRSENKDERIYFPYGSISKIKMGLLGLSVEGGGWDFFFPSTAKSKADLKEVAAYAQNRMKNAPKLPVEYTDYIKLKQDFFHSQEIQFYQACEKVGLHLKGNSSKADSMKAELLAQQNSFPVDAANAVAFYQAGKEQLKFLELYQKREMEADLAKKQRPLLQYRGREREIFRAQELVNYYKALQDHIQFGKGVPQEREGDWALMGGIASAVAGGAAGAAVAYDIQRRNAEIRARNGEVRSTYIKAMLPVLSEVYESKNKWEKKLERAKIALMADKNPEELFKRIEFSEEEVFVFYDGSFMVKASAKCSRVRVEKTVLAKVEGTLTAVVSQDGEVIAKVPVVFTPSSETNYQLAAVCDDRCADRNKKCTVVFVPNDLWVIEE